MQSQGPTKRFRRQHAELTRMARELTKAALTPGLDAAHVQRLLRRFVGKLRVHAVMETEALYPCLLEHEDPAIRERAVQLHGELAPLYSLVDALVEDWGTADKIEARRVRFRIELTRCLAKLGWRMMKENRDLYPLADATLSRV